MKSLTRWDPFGIMGKWDPFDELKNLQHRMDGLFDRFLSGRAIEGGGDIGAWMPTIESFTKDGKLTVRAEVPGVEAKDLDVSVSERELVIKGERRTEKDEKEKEYAYREINYGSFERHLPLPVGAKTEDLKAKFSNGVLEIVVPVPELPKAKKVLIETKAEKQIESGPSTVKKAA
jgi:HSP20 family protein